MQENTKGTERGVIVGGVLGSIELFLNGRGGGAVFSGGISVGSERENSEKQEE